MKNFTAIILILLITLMCRAEAQQIQTYNNEQAEINLDINTPAKEYNLNKTDLRNNPQIEQSEEDEIPVNFMQLPMQLLKQYQNDKL